MRLGEHAEATIAAALDAGITLFDTARAYPGNEALIAAACKKRDVSLSCIVTKGGMSRPGGAWVPDGRAKAIRADCEASLAALDGLPIDLYLLHAPDPRTPWATSVRALAKLADEGLVRRIGVGNVNRRQLDEALALAPIAAVQVAISPFDEHALRGGIVERCAEAGVTVLAHSPFGGPKRASRLARDERLVAIAAAHDATPAEVALAQLLALGVVPLVGATRPETARSAARAAQLELGDTERAWGARKGNVPLLAGREVVVVMGIPGAGKTRVAAELEAEGYERLNRDARGGTLRDIVGALDERLAAGAGRLVLDNTYLSRASRSYVLEAAARHGARARCVWLDTPLAQAQVNTVERVLDRFGALPKPDDLRAAALGEPGLLLPTSQMRALRELEPPEEDEGWAAIERTAFVRAPRAGRPGVFVAASALDGFASPEPDTPHLVFDWRTDDLEVELPVNGPVETAICPHGGGPPSCWCRPPLPGLPLAFARRHGVDPARSVLVGTSPAHRTLATTLGARFVAAPDRHASR